MTVKSFGERVVAVAAGDFDGDGHSDLAVVSPTGNNNCRVDIFLSNSNLVLSTASMTTIDSQCTFSQGIAMTAGDIDGDGRTDLVVASVQDMDHAGLISSATVYRNNGGTGVPTFSSADITSMLSAQNVAWHAQGGQLQLYDWDLDGKKDLFVLSANAADSQVLIFNGATQAVSSTYLSPTPTVILDNIPFFGPVASQSTAATPGFGCATANNQMVTRGGTLLAIADWTNNNSLGIRVGSVSEQRLLYYVKTPGKPMVRQPDYAFAPGSAAMAFTPNMYHEIYPNFTLVRSGAHCKGPPGEVYIYENVFYQPYDLKDAPLGTMWTPASFGAVLDINQDGIPDVLAGRSLGDGNYFLYAGQVGTSSVDLSSAQSTTVNAAINSNTYSIVAVKVDQLAYTNSKASGQLYVYMSNDGGRYWELLSGCPITASSTGPNEVFGQQTHYFSHYGSDLRFRFKLGSSSLNITNFSFTYQVASRAYFTRSNTAEATVGTGPDADRIFSAGFYAPGFDARLTATSLATVTAGASDNNTLVQVNNGPTPLFEAGSKLASRTGSTRTLYTSIPSPYGSTSSRTQQSRITFNAAQATAPTTSPTLAQLLGVAPGDAQADVKFLTGGMNRTDAWKFLDPGHSSPVVVNPPNQDPNYMQNNYASFVAAQANRAPRVLIGANDGMLHAFDAITGDEVWGYIPTNVLPIINAQRVTDPNSGLKIYGHSNFVDGPVATYDVFSGGSWHTVAIVGQGQGSGYGGNNYYFGLDVTDPSQPVPLWEFTQPIPVGQLTCNPEATIYTCSNTCTNTSSTHGACGNENRIDDAKFIVSVATPDPQGGAAGLIEAEHQDDSQAATAPATATWVTPAAMPAAEKAAARNGSYIEAQASVSCPGGSAAAAAACAQASYRFAVNPNAAGTLTPWFRIYDKSGATAISWALDGNWVQTLTPSFSGSSLNSWQWVAAQGVAMTAGEHVLALVMNQAQVDVDAIAVQASSTTAPPTAFSETYNTTCDWQCALTNSSGSTQVNGCVPTQLSDPNTQEWPMCGYGAGQQCCADGNSGYCAPLGSSCAFPPAGMGQAFSRPAVGRIATASGDRWVAFFASGYNTSVSFNVGRSLYAVDAYDGTLLGTWNLPHVTNASVNDPNIAPTMPASVTPVDVDNDGYVDRVYAADLAGRLWKLNTHKTISVGAGGTMANANDYTTCVVFDAGNPTQSQPRVWAPIHTKPAVAVLNPGTANIYFGTGGDDTAPATNMYKFYSVRDSDGPDTCTTGTRKETDLTITNLEWVVGDGYTNTNPQVLLSDAKSEGINGDKYWADPLIVDATQIYFSSLTGSIENVDPCSDIQGTSKVFGYAIAAYVDAAGTYHRAGQSILDNAAYVTASGPIRNAAILRNDPSPSVVHGVSTPVATAASDVFMQQFGGQVVKLSTTGVTLTSPLKLIRWREISF